MDIAEILCHLKRSSPEMFGNRFVVPRFSRPDDAATIAALAERILASTERQTSIVYLLDRMMEEGSDSDGR